MNGATSTARRLSRRAPAFTPVPRAKKIPCISGCSGR